MVLFEVASDAGIDVDFEVLINVVECGDDSVLALGAEALVDSFKGMFCGMEGERVAQDRTQAQLPRLDVLTNERHIQFGPLDMRQHLRDDLDFTHDLIHLGSGATEERVQHQHLFLHAFHGDVIPIPLRKLHRLVQEGVHIHLDIAR